MRYGLYMISDTPPNMSQPESTAEQVQVGAVPAILQRHSETGTITPEHSGDEEESAAPQTELQDARHRRRRAREPAPAPMTTTPPTRRRDHPGRRKWVYGIGFDNAFLDKWCTENDFGPLDNPLDQDVAHSEFFSSLKMDFLSRHGLPTTWCVNAFAGGYLPPPSDDVPVVISVLWLTDNELGSQAVEDISAERVERYRKFMGVEKVTPLWYAVDE